MEVGVIGAGNISSSVHLPLLSCIDDVNIKFIADRKNPETLAKLYNTKSIELDELTKKCDQVDVLIHDAQYIEDDMPLKHGWGHSLINQVTQLGINANVKKLIYYHHDPERDDESLDNQAKKVAEDIKKSDSNVETYFAKEGLKINL